MGNRKKLYNYISELLKRENIDNLKEYNERTIAISVLGLGYFENVRNIFKHCGYKISSMSDNKRWNILLEVIRKVVDYNAKENN